MPTDGIGNAYLRTPVQTAVLQLQSGAWISLPSLALMGAAAYAILQMRKPSVLKYVEECNEKYCHQTHVDRPLNTLLKDQSAGAGLTVPPKSLSLRTPYEVTKNDYVREARESPGVRLVAHAVV